MSTRGLLITAIAGLFLAIIPLSAHAGFGITPPYVRNDSLTRNSAYDQRIILTRSDPVEDLTAQVTIDVPEADDWITIDKGMSFTMPKGASQVPMIVRVRVPKDAKFKDYTGNIRVVIAPAGGPTPGTVGIALGAQIDVDLNVVDKKIYDFHVGQVSLGDLEEGSPWWGFFFPGKIKFAMQIENVGNVKYGPSRVVFDIYDPRTQALIETDENLNRLQRVDPLSFGEVVAEIPTRVPAGAYRAVFRIYNDQDVVRQGELTLSVLPRGSIPGYAGGFGFLGLTRKEQAIIVFGLLGIASLCILLIRLVLRLFRKRRRRA
jgi:hypothetical protein